jgi:protein-L-isoaspartate(D-aspartate) O-methyltransferase
MTQALELAKSHKVLEIGTGSGYQTAILCRLARRVYTIERIRELHIEATQRLERMKIRNVTTLHGDGGKGWPEQAPFDRIIVTAAAKSMPATLKEQLAVGGILVIPVGGDPTDQVLLKIRRTETGYESETLAGVRFVPLVGGLG